jgi:phosphate transport system permease protein
MTDLLIPDEPRVELPTIVPAETGKVDLAQPPRTVIPRRAEGGPTPIPRPIGKTSREDVLNMGGAAISALASTWLLFGQLTPLSGRLGFVIVAFALFLVIYAALVSLDNDRPAVVDRVMAATLTALSLVALFALTTVIVFTFVKGWSALFKPNLYTQDMSTTGPLDPLGKGGIAHAIVGSLITIALALILTVPLGLACAVYLNESRGRGAKITRTVVTAMTALPSILAGLFIFATWILILGFERSGLAASLAISIMMLPIIIRAADVVLRLVPGNLREASAALGAPQWRTVWHVVLPTARSGLTTSVILGMARGIGETAPVLLTAGVTASFNFNPTSGPMITLPLAVFEFVRSPQPTQIARGFAAAAVLMVMVLVLFVIARVIGGRPPGHQSKRQLKRTAARSAKDLARFEARAGVPAVIVPANGEVDPT